MRRGLARDAGVDITPNCAHVMRRNDSCSAAANRLCIAHVHRHCPQPILAAGHPASRKRTRGKACAEAHDCQSFRAFDRAGRSDARRAEGQTARTDRRGVRDYALAVCTGLSRRCARRCAGSVSTASSTRRPRASATSPSRWLLDGSSLRKPASLR